MIGQTALQSIDVQDMDEAYKKRLTTKAKAIQEESGVDVDLDNIVEVLEYIAQYNMAMNKDKLVSMFKEKADPKKIKQTLKKDNKHRDRIKYAARMKRFYAYSSISRAMRRFKMVLPSERVYLPLKPLQKKSYAQTNTEAQLKEMGYTVTDYAGGYATDKKGKQTFKIGKLLKKHKWSQEQFENDASRYPEKFRIVASQKLDDILQMSTGRNWASCMNINGAYRGRVIGDAGKGTIVLYMVKDDDPNITEPMARILLKPFKNKKGQIAYKAKKAYGLSCEIFEKNAENIANDITRALNGGRLPGGLFTIKRGIYADGITQFIQIPEACSAEEYFKITGIPHTKMADGTIIVNGDLDLSDSGLKTLPDLSNVEVAGTFNCSGNDLTSLKGCPKKVGSIICGLNPNLKSLEGAPKTVYNMFRCQDCDLQTLEGAPQQVKEFDCSRNPNLKSLKGGPIKANEYKCKDCDLESIEHTPDQLEKFNCSGNKNLPTLIGGPQQVKDYICARTAIDNLQGCPIDVVNFSCANNPNLTSLVNGPLKVTESYICNECDLNTLQGAPESCRDFWCGDNPRLTSLEFGPSEVSGKYICAGCDLHSLKHAPEKCGSFDASRNRNLISLEGGPREVDDAYACSRSGLTTLKGAPKKCKTFDCSHNKLTSSAHMPLAVTIKAETHFKTKKRSGVRVEID